MKTPTDITLDSHYGAMRTTVGWYVCGQRSAVTDAKMQAISHTYTLVERCRRYRQRLASAS